jgi:hypothetical protein
VDSGIILGAVDELVVDGGFLVAGRGISGVSNRKIMGSAHINFRRGILTVATASNAEKPLGGSSQVVESQRRG